MKTIFKDVVTIFVVLLFIGSFHTTWSQGSDIQNIAYIQKLLDKEALTEARIELEKQLDRHRTEKNTDSLIKYIALVGSLKLANGNHDVAIKRAETFGKELNQYQIPFVDKEALLELAWIYDDAGYTKIAYTTVEKALEIAKQIEDPRKADISGIYHNLGYLASNLGDMAMAKALYTMSIKTMEKEQTKDYESLHKTYNALGGMMWYSAKLDSSLYYFNQAYKMLEQVEKNPMNSYYRPALVKMNMAVLNHALGHVDDAIQASKEVIASFQTFIEISTDESKKLRALKHQLAAIDNLGSFYHSIGEFERADELISYSYRKKLKTLAPEDNNITISQIISAQAKMGLRDFNAANNLIDQALYRINTSKNTQFYWHASALSTKATISDELGDFKNADKYFVEADSLYRQSLGNNEYTRDFLDELIDMSLFYAKIQDTEKAISLAEECYHFIKTSDFNNTLQGFHHILNLAEVHFKLKHYKDAQAYSNEALNMLNNKNLITTNFTDSIRIQYRKPKALLINAKSSYYLNTNKTDTFLKELLNQLNNGIAILNQRKEIIKSYDDLSLLITENNELFDFSKQILLDLYNLTDNQAYLSKFLTLHESSVYNRIRSRLNLKNNLAFANIPKAIIARETYLKSKMNASIESATDGSFETFFNTNSNWNSFLDSLKDNYPKYYKMRYASIEEPLNKLHKNIPENTTVVRYVFNDNNLYAIVLTKNGKQIFKLNYKTAKNDMLKLTENPFQIKSNGIHLYNLYKTLWKPLEPAIATKKVIIIPDGELFNLSFEMLTDKAIQSYSEFTTNSLLAKHIVSYNYSLFLLGNETKTIGYKENFIAFVPEFNDKMKEEYQIKIKDSLDLDKAYLTLLPQPFTKDLAEKSSHLFNGYSFLNENSTEHIFKNSAKEHKIIHIGTHAESNNLSPELSRLVFAKSTDASAEEDGYLYTYEIYNINLSSNLAILTACETGKPSYQAGEGMISLAHAFNYAGSESILTSLWKVDEQSSAEIIELFYKNIKNGMDKDLALQQAKLSYLTTAKGRTMNPQYWAGLVLIGDTSPINLTTSNNYLYWILGFAILSMLLIILKRQGNK
ncbi:MAG: CHAT domain-containing protein [Xanthomarina gelatinilytica]|uniref:CHAT domain-containing protein n=1 Tax=Xanthomarina gelatinilytica TaxID=1137281 RepID=UPI003A87BC19